jgi:hypothetical protein
LLIGDFKDVESLDELVGAKTAFRALKTLVMGWLEDVWATSNEISDTLLQNICSWVYNGKSPLYDPYLGRIL